MHGGHCGPLRAACGGGAGPGARWPAVAAGALRVRLAIRGSLLHGGHCGHARGPHQGGQVNLSGAVVNGVDGLVGDDADAGPQALLDQPQPQARPGWPGTALPAGPVAGQLGPDAGLLGGGQLSQPRRWWRLAGPWGRVWHRGRAQRPRGALGGRGRVAWVAPWTCLPVTAGHAEGSGCLLCWLGCWGQGLPVGPLSRPSRCPTPPPPCAPGPGPGAPPRRPGRPGPRRPAGARRPAAQRPRSARPCRPVWAPGHGGGPEP
jgi:hypothetical protein